MLDRDTYPCNTIRPAYIYRAIKISVDYTIEMSWIPRLNKKVMMTTLARIIRVSFFPMNLISRINDEMQTEVEVREKAMAVPSGRWL